MKKIFAAMLLLLFFVNCANAECSYRMQKKMLKNRRVVKKKVINAQIRGKMQAIQQLSAKDTCNSSETRRNILIYQKQIETLTNEKMCLKTEYKNSLRAIKAER